MITEKYAQNYAQPLYIVDPIYFPITENANLSEGEDWVERRSFVEMAEQEGQGEE